MKEHERLEQWCDAMPDSPDEIRRWMRRMPEAEPEWQPPVVKKALDRQAVMYRRNDDALVGPVDDENDDENDDEPLSEEARSLPVNFGDLETVAHDLASAAAEAIGVRKSEIDDALSNLSNRIDAIEGDIEQLYARISDLEVERAAAANCHELSLPVFLRGKANAA